MTRRDDAGGILEGDGTEDTTLDDDGDNTGDAGEQYRGCLRFGTTTAEAARGPWLDQLLAEEEPDPVGDALGGLMGATVVPAVSWLSWSAAATDRTRGPIRTSLGWTEAGLSAEEAALHVIPRGPAPRTAE